MKGEVHDPRAFLLGGVAGHAGLFSTAADLVTYGRAMLAAAKPAASPLFSKQTFQLMTTPRDVLRGTRTYGWDHRSPYSKNRGEHLSERAFGHGGFTGTVLWIDPEKELIYIFLSSAPPSRRKRERQWARRRDRGLDSGRQLSGSTFAAGRLTA